MKDIKQFTLKGTLNTRLIDWLIDWLIDLLNRVLNTRRQTIYTCKSKGAPCLLNIDYGIMIFNRWVHIGVTHF